MKLMRLLETTTPLEGAKNEMDFWFEDIQRKMERGDIDKLPVPVEYFKIAIRKYNQLKKKGAK